MDHEPIDPRDPVDARVNSPGREGLTGTAPANLYAPVIAPEQITVAPDWRPPEAQPHWRQDFPIDMPQDQYVARRDFMKFMILTSTAFAAGQLWIGVQNWLRRRRSRPEIMQIASLGQLPVGGAMAFSYPGADDRCLLMRPSAGVLVAFNQECTHLSCAVLPKMDEGRLYCPCHHGVFDLASGRPLAGPPQRPLSRVQLQVRGEAIYATGVELRTG